LTALQDIFIPAYLFYEKIRPKANMKNFITNSESENLKKRLIELIQKSDLPPKKWTHS
jgi:hypothetical protein